MTHNDDYVRPIFVPVGQEDNPHACILDDSVPCLACELIHFMGEERRLEALDLASIIAAQIDQSEDDG